MVKINDEGKKTEVNDKIKVNGQIIDLTKLSKTDRDFIDFTYIRDDFGDLSETLYYTSIDPVSFLIDAKTYLEDGRYLVCSKGLIVEVIEDESLKETYKDNDLISERLKNIKLKYVPFDFSKNIVEITGEEFQKLYQKKLSKYLTSSAYSDLFLLLYHGLRIKHFENVRDNLKNHYPTYSFFKNFKDYVKSTFSNKEDYNKLEKKINQDFKKHFIYNKPLWISPEEIYVELLYDKENQQFEKPDNNGIMRIAEASSMWYYDILTRLYNGLYIKEDFIKEDFDQKNSFVFVIGTHKWSFEFQLKKDKKLQDLNKNKSIYNNSGFLASRIKTDLSSRPSFDTDLILLDKEEKGILIKTETKPLYEFSGIFQFYN